MQLKVKRSPFLCSVPSWKETHGLGLFGRHALYHLHQWVRKNGGNEILGHGYLNTLSMDTSDCHIQFWLYIAVKMNAPEIQVQAGVPLCEAARDGGTEGHQLCVQGRATSRGARLHGAPASQVIGTGHNLLK